MKCPLCLGGKQIKQMTNVFSEGWRLVDCPACEGKGEPGENQWWLGKVGEAEGIVAQLVDSRWVVRGEYTTVYIENFVPTARLKEV